MKSNAIFVSQSLLLRLWRDKKMLETKSFKGGRCSEMFCIRPPALAYDDAPAI